MSGLQKARFIIHSLCSNLVFLPSRRVRVGSQLEVPTPPTPPRVDLQRFVDNPFIQEAPELLLATRYDPTHVSNTGHLARTSVLVGELTSHHRSLAAKALAHDLAYRASAPLEQGIAFLIVETRHALVANRRRRSGDQVVR
jgi:hypothetical protein